MGEKQAAPVLVMVAVLVLAAATPTAYGQVLNPVTQLSNQLIRGVNISARVCCSPTGNCNATTAPLQGARVNVVCLNGLLGTTTVVGTGVTSADGTVNIVISNILSLLGLNVNDVLSKGMPCVATMDLPVQLQLNQVCQVLSNTTGILVGPLNIVNSLLGTVVGALTGLLATVRVSAFLTLSLLN